MSMWPTRAKMDCTMGGSTAHMDQFLCSRVFETSQEDAKGAAALTCWRSRHTAPLRTKRDVSKHFEKPETVSKQGHVRSPCSLIRNFGSVAAL